MKNANTPDERVQKTMKKIEKALFRLTKTYQPTDITITMLCKEAGINRTTFYSYFNSISNVLDYFQQEYIKLFVKEINEQWTSKKGIKQFYYQMLLYIFQNQDPFLYLFSDNQKFMDQIISLTLDKLTTQDERYTQLSKQELLSTKIFNAYGCIGLLNLWVRHGCEESIETMTNYLYDNVTKTLRIY